jgi:hypothetical protein
MAWITPAMAQRVNSLIPWEIEYPIQPTMSWPTPVAFPFALLKRTDEAEVAHWHFVLLQDVDGSRNHEAHDGETRRCLYRHR